MKTTADMQAELDNANRLLDDYRWQLDHNRLPASERYQRDPVFRALVDAMVYHVRKGEFTPTELREASILAATIYDTRPMRPLDAT